MIYFYKVLMGVSGPVLSALLKHRCRRGKEDPERLEERKGIASAPRPDGQLIWFHAASVGEAQSTLILIDKLQSKLPQARFLVTTGTVTSAALMQSRLPDTAIHQYYPLDHPSWVKRFLSHWRPDLIFWMESEIWPNMLAEIKAQDIPAALLNARLSPRSLKRWQKTGPLITRLLKSFKLILAQTDQDRDGFKSLGLSNVRTGGNLKYAASPLPCDPAEKERLEKALVGRPLWLYASTHAGEEEIAARIHQALKPRLPHLLTLIVPRHPERGEAIQNRLEEYNLHIRRRSVSKDMPREKDDIYLADTLGELGLFYRLSPIACIGRSLSDDGGGGHNPIEAAQLGCVVLHGPHVQNLGEIYREMDEAKAALPIRNEKDLQEKIETLLSDPKALQKQQSKGLDFTERKAAAIDQTLNAIIDWQDDLNDTIPHAPSGMKESA